MAKVNLTDRAVTAAKADQGQRLEIWDALTPGLCLRVTDAGVKSWVLRYRTPDGRQPRFKIGDASRMGLRAARLEVGRLKDVIIRKGENISAKEIEDLLYPHPKVGDVAVVGLPDRERGELVCAVIERSEGQEDLTFEEMVETLEAAQLMRQKIPERIEIVDRFPRNETLQKVMKFKLREMFS